MERWLPVVGFEGLYSVSDPGRVRSDWHVLLMRDGRHRTVNTRILRPRPISGYPNVTLWRANVSADGPIHRLVLEAFVGRRPPGMEACHNDGDRTNNHVGNIRWDSVKANASDREKHGTQTRGETHHTSKLTQADVDEIRSLRRRGLILQEIAGRFGVCISTISQICRNQSWSHLPSPKER